MSRIKHYTQTEVCLKKHHIMSSVLTRLRKGYISVYDITDKDIESAYHHYISYAREKELPVHLEINGITRLLIFNKRV